MTNMKLFLFKVISNITCHLQDWQEIKTTYILSWQTNRVGGICYLAGGSIHLYILLKDNILIPANIHKKSLIVSYELYSEEFILNQ